MTALLLVMAGGGLGAGARHGINLTAAKFLGLEFPWGTLIANVVGSFAMGLIVGWLAFRADVGWSQHLRLFLTTGFLGGFTTFSAFTLDAMVLWERGAAAYAVGYVLASVGLSLMALMFAIGLFRAAA